MLVAEGEWDGDKIKGAKEVEQACTWHFRLESHLEHVCVLMTTRDLMWSTTVVLF